MVNSEVATSSKPPRVLFARIGWMKYYAGPQKGDVQPKGGGAYNRQNIGHELFNFADCEGRLYGYAAANINLKRIDPTAEATEQIDDVLVIFVASQHIIGWYRNATVHASTKPKFPPSATKEMLRRLKLSGVKGFKLIGYRFEAGVEGATLLPTHERKQEVPGHVKGGFGQTNVRYLYRNNGKTDKAAWMNKAIQYALTYDGANLLSNPSAEVNSEEAAAVAQEQAAGFQSDPEIRRLIERHAMKKAEKELKKRGFADFKDTSATKPYDFTCIKDAGEFFVEVKGTQTLGKAIILTKNEVEHVKANVENCILVVVHSVVVANQKSATGGVVEILENWDLGAGRLSASQYVWER